MMTMMRRCVLLVALLAVAVAATKPRTTVYDEEEIEDLDEQWALEEDNIQKELALLELPATTVSTSSSSNKKGAPVPLKGGGGKWNTKLIKELQAKGLKIVKPLIADLSQRNNEKEIAAESAILIREPTAAAGDDLADIDKEEPFTPEKEQSLLDPLPNLSLSMREHKDETADPAVPVVV